MRIVKRATAHVTKIGASTGSISEVQKAQCYYDTLEP